MAKHTTKAVGEVTIGLDLGDKWSEAAILDADGEVVERVRVRLIAQGDSKTDEFDAELLARLGRVDPNLLSPIVHRGEEAQRDLTLIRSRDGLVRARTQMIN